MLVVVEPSEALSDAKLGVDVGVGVDDGVCMFVDVVKDEHESSSEFMLNADFCNESDS